MDETIRLQFAHTLKLEHPDFEDIFVPEWVTPGKVVNGPSEAQGLNFIEFGFLGKRYGIVLPLVAQGLDEAIAGYQSLNWKVISGTSTIVAHALWEEL